MTLLGISSEFIGDLAVILCSNDVFEGERMILSYREISTDYELD